MNIFYYDGSVEGLFSAIFDAYTLKVFPDTMLLVTSSVPLLATFEHTVETVDSKVNRVITGLEKRFDKKDMQTVMHACLSDSPESHFIIFRFLCKVFDAKKFSWDNYGDKDIFAFHRLIKKIYSEAHSLKGFIRFQKTTVGVYFSLISPQYNVIPLLLPHFKDRFSCQHWIIYDEGRDYGISSDGNKLSPVYLDSSDIVDCSLKKALLDEDDSNFQKIWHQYCSTISIKERENKKAQRQKMPERFWKYMVEKQNILDK